ncbi:MAG TPA: hypothetical protein VF773_17545 [Verrucomicrobiae bacterium]
MLTILVLSAVAYRVASGSGVKRQVAEIKARRLPVSPEELDLWYRRVPATSNAALAYLEAYSFFVQPGTNNPNEMKVKLALGEPLPAELNTAIDAHLAKNRETLEQLHAAAALPESRYPIDLTKGFETLLPHLAYLKSMAFLLQWEAINQSARGNRPEALRAIKTAFALARTLEGEPLLISDLVRIAIIAINLPAVERVVSEQELSDAELGELMDLLARTETSGADALKRAMIGERALGMAAFNMDFRMFEALSLDASTGLDDFSDLLKVGLFEARRVLGATDRDLGYYITRMTEYERATEKEFPEMLREAQLVSEKVESEVPQNRIRYLISGMLLPSLSVAAKKEAVLAGQLRCARLALAAERFRLAHERFPDARELVPTYITAIPDDPVDGAPLDLEILEGSLGAKGTGIRVESLATTAVNKKGTKSTNLPEVAFTILRKAKSSSGEKRDGAEEHKITSSGDH